MTVHRRCKDNVLPKDLRRATMNKFCSNEDWVPVKL